MLMRIQQLAYQCHRLPLVAARPRVEPRPLAAAQPSRASPGSSHTPQRLSDPGLFYNVLVEDSTTFKAI